jgi:predicted membrane-bound spermidine synthase
MMFRLAGLLVFFLSGFAALLYQVIWQRLLVLFSGADVYSVTIIVSAFMGGLGLGSLAGGRLADRLGATRCLWAFVGAEVLIGTFGLLSKAVYYDQLAVRLPQWGAEPATAAVVLVASLLVPTFLMGMSLPLLARAMTDSLRAAAVVAGSLYGWNTMGAAIGAFASTWLLVPRLGFERSLLVGASVNFVCAVGATAIAALSRGRPGTMGGSTEDIAASPRGDDRVPFAVPPSLPFWTWALLYALTGFIALGVEIAWFRLLGVILKSTAFTFGTLLTVYLGGLGLGGAVGACLVDRSRRPGATFLWLQYGVTLYAALSLAALMALVGAGQPALLADYLVGYDPMDVAGAIWQWRDWSWSDPGRAPMLRQLVLLYVVMPAAIVGPPTFLMGLSFPYLQRASQSDLEHLGSRLGALMASNIAGAMCGAMATGWLLLPAIGTAGTMRTLVASGAVLAWPLWRLRQPHGGRGRVAAPLAGAITLTAVAVMPASSTLWARLHGSEPRMTIAAEDGGGLSVLRSDQNGRQAVFVNGLGQSWIPYGGIHTVLGALPLAVHPRPREVLVIGLGSGDTAFAAAARPDVQRVVCVEIIGAQLDTLRRLATAHPYAGLTGLLSDPRFDHRVGDGRAFLIPEERRFDVIEADALRPTSAYAGNLYSREYFDLLRRRLNPGGLAVSWGPTGRTIDTFASVFPYTLVFGDVMIGSEAPIAFDRATVAARVAAMRDYFSPAGVDIVSLLRLYVMGMPRLFDPNTPRRRTDLNSDLFPRDEFGLPE